MMTNRPSDYVMKEHLAGRFANAAALDLLVSRITSKTCVLDVGAGFGNSTLFAAAILEAREVIPIEPYPEAVEVLRANVEINALDNVDMSLLGIALGERDEVGRIHLPYTTHLGGAQVIADVRGRTAIYRGDNVLLGKEVDLILVDVNGREIEVLAGLSLLTERCRPLILASSAPRVRARLDGFLGHRGYRPGPSVDLHGGKQSFVLFEPRLPEPNARPTLNNVRHTRGTLASWKQDGTAFRFFVTNPYDSVQSCHMAGRFYEEEELTLIARYIPSNARVLDCGANVGNHVVAFEKLLGAKRVVAIEPNPTAIQLLHANCGLNTLKSVDLTRVGIALGNVQGTCQINGEPPDNLGGTTITESISGTVKMARADDLLGTDCFDLIKIDVEGYEVAVLKGLVNTLKRSRPLLFVEVEDKNRAEFTALTVREHYEIFEEYQRYPGRVNLFARPRN